MRFKTFRHKIVVWWFSVSLFVMCCTEDAPIWFYLIETASLVASAYFLAKIPVPESK